MRELSLFTGGGGSIWASKLLGWSTIGYCESDQYCRKIIEARIADGIFDEGPIFEDIKKLDGSQFKGRCDIVTAGFPCQPFSVAGQRKVSEDHRNLWPDTVRILRESGARFALLENVPGLLTSGYFGRILSDLSQSGFDARWEIVSAAEVGAPHIRKRLWIFAYSNSSELREQSRRSSGASWEDTTLSLLNGKQRDMAYSESIGARRLSEREETQISELRKCGEDFSDTDCSRQLQSERSEQEFGRRAGDNSWWNAEPELGRVANGVANRGHRLKALGNGWVPAVAIEAFRRLTK